MFRLTVLIVATVFFLPTGAMAAFPAVPDYLMPDYVKASGAEGFLSLWTEGGNLYMNIAPRAGSFALDGTRFTVSQLGVVYNIRLETESGAAFSGSVSAPTTFRIACTTSQSTCFNTAAQIQVTFHGTTDYVIQAMVYDGGSGAAYLPRSGWWWNPNENGRGVNIEIQGTTLFMSWYAYDKDTGESTWISSGGPMTDTNHYTGRMQRFRNGQCIGCAYVAPDAPPEDIGEISITFTDDSTATLQAPSQGVDMTISRFVFGAN